jgi:hypothetical protein
MNFALLAFAVAGNDSASILFLCAIMAIALIVYTFYVPANYAHGTEKTRASFLKERKEQVYENLRDLNFEYKAGKLPETDYQQMRGSLEDEGASLLAEIERLESAPMNPVYKGVSATLNKSKGARS